MQETIVIIIVAIAFLFTIRWIVSIINVIKGHEDACKQCPCSEQCQQNKGKRTEKCEKKDLISKKKKSK